MPTEAQNRMQAAGFAAAPAGAVRYWSVYSMQNFGTLADGATGIDTVQIQADSDFLIQQIIAAPRKGAAGTGWYADYQTNAFIQLTDTGSGMQLFDQPQLVPNVMGNLSGGMQPYVLPTPRLVRANSALQATLLNNTGGNLNLQVSFLGQKRFNVGAPDKSDGQFWSVYSIRIGDSTAIANGAAGSGTVRIEAESDFLIQHLCGYGRVDNSGELLALGSDELTVQLTDTSTGLQLFDQAQPFRNVFGTARQPYILPTPKLMPANTSLRADITNNTGGDLQLYLSFLGKKIYPLRAR